MDIDIDIYMDIAGYPDINMFIYLNVKGLGLTITSQVFVCDSLLSYAHIDI